jgi:nucleotide-binding universal stress UspA family protein
MKKILVPVDFSAEAESALQTAIKIAKKIKAEIHLLHIVESAHSQSFSVTGTYIQHDPMNDLYMKKLIEISKEKLAEISNKPELYDLDVVSHLKVGNVYQNISETITSFEIDLIVMGTQGASGLEEVIIGSNTEKVVRTAKCPVLTVKKFNQNFELRNLVFATDLQNVAPEFIAKLNQWQKLFGFTIHLVYVNTPGSFRTSNFVDAKLEDFSKRYLIENATFNIYNALDEEEGIRDFAKKVNADLIAMTTHGRKGFANMMWGSISEDMVNQSPIPVLTFRSNIVKEKANKDEQVVKV